MALLSIPDENFNSVDARVIRAFMNDRGIFFDQWTCSVVFDDRASQEEILTAYSKDLKPFMERGGYLTADEVDA